MKKILKATGIALGLLVVLALIALSVVYQLIESKRRSTIPVKVATIAVPTDPASLKEGQRLVQVKACADCHGTDLGGKTFIDEAPIGTFAGSNLTRGKGSATLEFKDEDWIRAIRYAIGPDGHPLIAMPAGDYHGMTNDDLGKMIAYLKSVPPVDRESLPQRIGPMARVLALAGQMPLLFPFEEVDLNATPLDHVEIGATVEYGKYLSMACTGCHGPGFSGGHIPGTPPAWPDAKNLTPSGRFATWAIGDFKRVLQEGLTADGHQIDPRFMPWKSTQAMNDIEVEALFRFLKQLPARAEGTR